MDARERRAAIKQCFLEGLSACQTQDHLYMIYEKTSHSYSMIKESFAKFRRGEMTLDDAPRSGRPKTAVNEEIAEKIRHLIVNNRKVSVRDISKKMKISKGSAGNVLKRVLKVKKLKRKWLPRELTPDVRERRVALSNEFACVFGDDT